MERYRRGTPDVTTRTTLALAMIGGPANVPSSYLRALQEAQNRRLGFWPQIGEASHLSAALLTKTVRDHVEGRLTAREKLFELE
jgi:hypothetical protein